MLYKHLLNVCVPAGVNAMEVPMHHITNPDTRQTPDLPEVTSADRKPLEQFVQVRTSPAQLADLLLPNSPTGGKHSPQ